MKGIIFEIRDNKAVIMKQGGSFVSLPAQPDWVAGDVVTVRQPPAQFRRFAALAAGIALMLSLGLGGYGLYYTPVALLSVDVNPSLEISLNRFDRVVGTASHNAESQAVLEALNVRNMPYSQAVELLMQDDYLGSYMAQGGYLVVSVQASGQQKQALMLQNLQSATEAAVAHHGEVTAEYYAVDGETVAAAHRHGVTAGKYMVLMELAQVDPGVDIQEYSHCTVEEIKGQIKRHGSNGMHGGNSGNNRHRGRHR